MQYVEWIAIDFRRTDFAFTTAIGLKSPKRPLVTGILHDYVIIIYLLWVIYFYDLCHTTTVVRRHNIP